MKTTWILAGFVALVALSVSAWAITDTVANASVPDWKTTMDAMHEQMTQSISDPVLKQQMDEMHAGCVAAMENGISMKDHMKATGSQMESMESHMKTTHSGQTHHGSGMMGMH